ncbi:unnamed protein product [Adineta steineri]|uniref:Cardiolipin synthase N-terminal domain-containing protein n=1 Tax=Adineta steineri TaxID=433720 RepID=A0A819MN97_9BILA|nr:unnamed protein product [Adineta steineri]CAF1446489.1 unnamed protein product [Adineta steineri]CAF3820891.1 unnamed protein product [Adineta steineri]CAF3983515.1 unnamed protein product [Adineta steineri]
MYSSFIVTILFLFIQLVLGAHVDDNRIIIGSSVGGVLGLIILILDLIAIFELLKSGGRGVCSKLIWILIIIFFPIGGLILYCCCARSRTVDEIV